MVNVVQDWRNKRMIQHRQIAKMYYMLCLEYLDHDPSEGNMFFR